MESDEKYIESRFGKSTPFVVPDGYFDSLAQTMMEKVDAFDQTMPPSMSADDMLQSDVVATHNISRSWWLRYRRYVAAAACVAFLAVGVSTFYAVSSNKSVAENHVASACNPVEANGQSGSTYDAEIEYSMLDNQDMYSLMASN